VYLQNKERMKLTHSWIPSKHPDLPVHEGHIGV